MHNTCYDWILETDHFATFDILDNSVYLRHSKWYVLLVGTSLLCLFFHLLCYALMLKIFTYYAQYYVHVKD